MVFMPMGYVIDKSEKAKFDRKQSETGYLPKDVPLLESFRILKDGKPSPGLVLDPEHYRKFIDWLANGPPQPVPPVALRILCHYKKMVEEAKEDINTTDGMRLKQDNLIRTIEELIKGGDDNKDAAAMCLTGGAGEPEPAPSSECCEEIKPEIAAIKTTVETLGTKAELDEIKTLIEALKTNPSTFDLKGELLKILQAAPSGPPAASAPEPGQADPGLMSKLDEILAKLGAGNNAGQTAVTAKLGELEAILNTIGPKLNALQPHPPPGPDPHPIDPGFQALVTEKLTKIDADLEGFKQPIADVGTIKAIMEKGFADLSGAIHSIGSTEGADGADGAAGTDGKIDLPGIHKLLTAKFTELDKILLILKPIAEGSEDTKLEGFLKTKFNEISEAIGRIHTEIPKPDFTELEAHIHVMFEELKADIKGQGDGGDSITEIRTLITSLKSKEGISAEDLAKLDSLLAKIPKPAGDVSPALAEIKALIEKITIPTPGPGIDFTELKAFISELKKQDSLSDHDLSSIQELISKIGPGKDYETQLTQIIDSIRTPGGAVMTEVTRLIEQIKTLPSLKEQDKADIKAILEALPKPIDVTEKLEQIEASIRGLPAPVDHTAILNEIKDLVVGLNMAELKETLKTLTESKPLSEDDMKRIIKEQIGDAALAGLQTDVADLKDALALANKNITTLLERKAPKANLEDRAAEALGKMDKAERAAREALERLKTFDVAQASPNAMEDLSIEAKKQQARAQLYKEEAEELYGLLDQANVNASAEAGIVPQPGANGLSGIGQGQGQNQGQGQRGGAGNARQLREAKASAAEGSIKNLGDKLVEFNAQLKEKRKPPIPPTPEDCGPLHVRIAALEAELAAKETELASLRDSLKGKSGNAQEEMDKANLLLAEVAKLKATIKKVTGEVPDESLNAAVNAHLAGDDGLKTTIKKVVGEVPEGEFDPRVVAHMSKYHGLKKTIKKVTGEVPDVDFDAKVTAHMAEYNALKERLVAMEGQIADFPNVDELRLRLQKEINKAAELEALIDSGASASTDVGALRQRVTELEAEVAALRAKHAEDKTTIASLREQLRVLNEACSAKETEAKGVATQLAAATVELGQLRIQITQLRGGNSEAKRQLERDLVECRAKVAELTRLNAELEGVIKGLRVELQSAKSALAAAQQAATYQPPAPAPAPYQPAPAPYQPPYQAPAQNNRWAKNMHTSGNKKQNKPIPSYMRTTESRKSAIQASTNQLSDLGSSRIGRGVNSYSATKKQPVARAVDSRPAWKRGGATRKGARLRKIKENIKPM
jgi:hypothetical protein